MLPPRASYIDRPSISEIPITPRSQQQSLTGETPMIHIPNSDKVATVVNYKQPIAIKTTRLQPQLDIVCIPDTEYPTLPSLQLPSDIESSTKSPIYSNLNPIRKHYTSLPNILETTSQDYIPSQYSHSSIIAPPHLDTPLSSCRLNTDTSTLIFPPQVIQHFVL